MNGNIYDDTDWGNDFTPYNGNRNTGYDENYDSCFDNDYGRGSLPINYMELPYRLDKMEKMLHDMCKRGKKHKKKKKKDLNRNQKFQKRLKAVEKQNDYIIGCLTVAMAQTQNPDKYAWLKKSIENSAPNIVDFASNVVTGKRRPLLPTQTLNQPLCLPDKNRGK